MSSSIGGIDLVLTAPRETFDVPLLLDVLQQFWPDGAYQDANEEYARPLSSAAAGSTGQRTGEFFAYEDDASARSWAQDGWAPANQNKMVHVLIQESPTSPDLLEITLVIDEITPEMAGLFHAIHSALASPRRRALDEELRAAGAKMTRATFYEEVEAVRQALYPQWTQDELACHPHDALQFCDVVRLRVGAPLPDHVILRAMLNQRKRARA